MPDKLTDSEIVKACKNCLHYEACKGTYYSAKGDEDILHDFDGEMYANSGCEDFGDKDHINRLQAENEQLFSDNQKYLMVILWGNKKDKKNLLKQIKAEAYKECIEKVNNIINEIYNKHIFGSNDLSDEEKDAVINFSDDVTYAFDNLLKELVGDSNGKEV